MTKVGKQRYKKSVWLTSYIRWHVWWDFL